MSGFETSRNDPKSQMLGLAMRLCCVIVQQEYSSVAHLFGDTLLSKTLAFTAWMRSEKQMAEKAVLKEGACAAAVCGLTHGSSSHSNPLAHAFICMSSPACVK